MSNSPAESLLQADNCNDGTEPMIDDHTNSTETQGNDERSIDNISVKIEVESNNLEMDNPLSGPEHCDGSLDGSQKKQKKIRSIGASENREALKETKDIARLVKGIPVTEKEREILHAAALQSLSNDAKFVCYWCAVGFSVEDEYLNHMILHSPEAGDHQCTVCTMRFKTPEELSGHKSVHINQYRCTICEAVFRDKDSAVDHVLDDHNLGRIYKCSRCDKEFRREQNLKRHEKTQHAILEMNQDLFKNRVYDPFKVDDTKIRFQQIQAEQSGQACEQCGEAFTTRAKLKRHMAQMHDMPQGKGHPCPFCERPVTTRYMLQRHIQRMHGDRTKKFECDHCQRLYFTKAEVREHISWSHAEGARGHACGCGRVFRTPALLRAHAAKAHSAHPAPPRRDHACTVCGKAFQSNHLLKRHMNVHTDRTYPCNECGRAFRSRDYVRTHYELAHMQLTRADIARRKRGAAVPVMELPAKQGLEINTPSKASKPTPTKKKPTPEKLSESISSPIKTEIEEHDTSP